MWECLRLGWWMPGVVESAPSVRKYVTGEVRDLVRAETWKDG